ncbi:unnamed protein product [Triticum turgidum subsp. durum]|nr:unnamed protein product [Triticum turgidum subsp. durum]
MKLNPDLYYNCATAYKYLENYESALRGFEAAALKDPALRADIEVQKIINLLDKLENATKFQLAHNSYLLSVSNTSLRSPWRMRQWNKILQWQLQQWQSHQSKESSLEAVVEEIGSCRCRGGQVKLFHKKATISILSGGLNKTVAVVCKVVLWIRHDDDAPLTFGII